MNSEFKELLRCFASNGVRYLVVGGYAVMHYTEPRDIKDLDLWLEPTAENSRRVAASFRQSEVFAKVLGFLLLPERDGASVIVRGRRPIDITEDDLALPGSQFFVGRSPKMLDLLTSVQPLEFELCWSRKMTATHDSGTVHYLALADLRIAKRHTARDVDLVDLEALIRN